jgi:hypothetical protein
MRKCRVCLHVTTQHNTTQHNTTQHNTTQHNTTQPPGELEQKSFCSENSNRTFLKRRSLTKQLISLVIANALVVTPLVGAFAQNGVGGANAQINIPINTDVEVSSVPQAVFTETIDVTAPSSVVFTESVKAEIRNMSFSDWLNEPTP